MKKTRNAELLKIRENDLKRAKSKLARMNYLIDENTLEKVSLRDDIKQLEKEIKWRKTYA